MANGYFERGEIYNVRMDNGIGSEEGSYRPGVIVSSEMGNRTNNAVVIAYLTTRIVNMSITMETMATGRRSTILGGQIATVDKSRLKATPLGKLTQTEIRKLDGILEEALDLGYVDDVALAEKDKEIEKLKAQIVELTGEVAREQTKNIELTAKHEEELLSYKVENAMWQKCYDKALGQLVDMKMSSDLVRRVEQKPVETPKTRELVENNPPVEPVIQNPPAKVLVTEVRVDINHCTQTQLKKIGFSDALARAVVAKRPFDSVKDLRNVPGMNAKKYQIFEPKLTCTPLEIIEVKEPETDEKLNINAVTGRELHEKTGLALSTAYFITGYRKQNGPYKKLEDLLNARQVFPATLDKLRGKIEFGPHVEEKPVLKHEAKAPDLTKYAGNKVNINTASAKEINEKTGLSMTICYSIVGYRKRDGKYRDVSDLENVPRFTEHHMKYYAPMFEV